MMPPGATEMVSAHLAEREQREITRLCVETALVLMQHGAESALVETLARRLGLALEWTGSRPASSPTAWSSPP